ncbi:MAG: hypothetical protein H6811_09970 [Phycisphaeraceae bacterium]|nr:hypothetical protein [Phycisphaeraceae bacterium]
MLVLGSERLALSIALTHPTVQVELYASDWNAVDHARESVFSQGLCDRITVRHRNAIAPFVGRDHPDPNPPSRALWPRAIQSRHSRIGDR